MRIFASFLLLTFFLTGCVKQPQLPPRSVSVLLKTPALKLNETGIIKHTQSGVRLEIYGSGVSVGGISIGEKVCVQGACFENVEFNQKYLGTKHYNEFLRDILTNKPIYAAKNFVQTQCGFSQRISHMVYEVCSGVSEFRDNKNRVIIRIMQL